MELQREEENNAFEPAAKKAADVEHILKKLNVKTIKAMLELFSQNFEKPDFFLHQDEKIRESLIVLFQNADNIIKTIYNDVKSDENGEEKKDKPPKNVYDIFIILLSPIFLPFLIVEMLLVYFSML